MEFRCFPRSDTVWERLWRGCVREVPAEPIKRRQKCRRENTHWRGRRKIGGSRFPVLCLRRGKMSRVETISLGFLRVVRARAPLSSGKVPFTPGDKTVLAGSLFDLAIKTRNTACLINERGREMQQQRQEQEKEKE